MGKFIVVALATLFVCGVCATVAPSTTHHAFFLANFDVRWMMLIGLGCIIGGYKLLGK